jgi:SAM-dependent methyltransferase
LRHHLGRLARLSTGKLRSIIWPPEDPVASSPEGKPLAFANCYEDGARAEVYATLEFKNTYHLAYRDIPAILGEHVRGGRKSVDFGCGTGRSTRYLRQLGFEVTGVDIAEDMIRKARELDRPATTA